MDFHVPNFLGPNAICSKAVCFAKSKKALDIDELYGFRAVLVSIS